MLIARCPLVCFSFIFYRSTTLYLDMSTEAGSPESGTSSSNAVTVSDGTVKGYLEAKGLKELIPIVVVRHGFKEVSDLHLLCKNMETMKSLDAPLCLVLKLKEVIDSESQENARKGQKPKELTKSELLVLCKTHIEAQVANMKLNRFNKLINFQIEKELEEWQGNARLRGINGTTSEEALNNRSVCKKILAEPEIKTLLGVYEIAGEGVVTLDSTRAMRHISGSLSQKRKNSAYKKLSPEEKKERLANAAKKRKLAREQAINNLKKKKETELVTDKQLQATEEPDKQEDKEEEAKNNLSDDILEVGGDEQEDKENAAENDSPSKYEQQRQKRIKENNLQLLLQGFVPLDQAVIVALFWLGATGISNVNMRNLKAKCKEHNIPSGPSPSKADLPSALGRILYEKKL